MQQFDLYDMWFPQDGATCHIACVTMDLFYFTFGTGHFPLDYFLWAYIKAHVYTDKQASIDALEDKTEEFIREIPAEV